MKGRGGGSGGHRANWRWHRFFYRVQVCCSDMMAGQKDLDLYETVTRTWAYLQNRRPVWKSLYTRVFQQIYHKDTKSGEDDDT